MKNESRKPLRHGDVILIPILKGSAKFTLGKKERELVLAYGEVTGHSHKLTKNHGALYSFDNKVYLDLQNKINTLTHEEHGDIELPCDVDYEIVIQRDYTPKSWEKVRD